MKSSNKTEIKAIPAYLPHENRYVIEVYTQYMAVYLTRRECVKLIWAIVLAACQTYKKNEDDEE